MKSPLLVIFALIFVFFSNATATTTTSSSSTHTRSTPKTISDKLKEFTYKFNGEVEINYDLETLLVSHFLDIRREVLSYPDDKEMQEKLKKILSSFKLFKEDFLSKYQNSWPIVNEKIHNINSRDAINTSALAIWVERQINFTFLLFQNDSTKNINLSLIDLKIENFSINTNNKTILVQYQATLNGIRKFDSHYNSTSNNDINESPLKIGDQFSVPKNTLRRYIDDLGIDEFYNSAVNAIKAEDIISIGIEADIFLNKTSDGNVKNLCYEKRGKIISPLNYFYYFSSTYVNCTNDITPSINLKVVDVQVKSENYDIYPEYHRLMEDGNVDIFIFFNKVGNEAPRKSKQLLALLKKRGFIEQKLREGRYILNKSVNDINFKVEVVVQEELAAVPNLPQQENPFTLLATAVRNEEIIIYDGHSGFGGNLSEVFSTSEAYPANKYQIIFLNACYSYSYAINEILSAKALKDFDFKNLNIDVVATYKSSVMSAALKDYFIEKLLAAAAIYKKSAGEWSAEDKKNLSWFAIIKKINAYDTHDAIYLVSGEQGNDYQPGKREFHFEPDSEDTITVLKRIILADIYPPSIKKKALEHLLNLEASKHSDYKEVLASLQNICLEYKKSIDRDVLSELFHIDSCQVSKFTSAYPYTINNVTWDSKTIFYYNYTTSSDSTTTQKLSRVVIPRPKQISNYLFKDGISFYDDGTIWYAGLAEPIEDKEKNITYIESINFFKDGKISGGKFLNNYKWNGITFMEFISFYENGNVSSGKNKFPVAFYEIQFKAAGWLSFHNNGKFSGGELSQNVELQGIEFKSYISFTENGKVKSGVLAKDQIISNIPLKADAYIELFENGQLAAGNINGRIIYQDLPLHNWIRFYENGQIENAYLYQAVSVKGIDFIESISFYPNGNIKSGKLAKDTTIQGIFFKQNSYINFKEDGQIVSP
ncbi:MAG: hypothetical protein HQK49_00440 [Oligoflexia bacterium]|nr:hypothetical protein [Oligoflexia bacterium]